MLKNLESWSLAVRRRASQVVAERQGDDLVPQLVKMLGSENPHARYGACNALGALQGRAATAVPS